MTEFIFVGHEVIYLRTISDLIYAEDRVREEGMSHAGIYTGSIDYPADTERAVFAAPKISL